MSNTQRRITVVALLILTSTLGGYVLTQSATAEETDSAQTRQSRRAIARKLAKHDAQPTNARAANRLANPANHPANKGPVEFRLTSGETVRPNVQQTPLADILKISQKIDKHVDSKLAEKDVPRAKTADDETFVRRVYLDIAGRIPTLEESNAFLHSKHRRKRSNLIDELLDSYGYVSRQYNFWADILRAKSNLRQIAGQPYIDYLKDTLSKNTPYDEFVREMLTSSGPNLQRGNGAVGYYLRDNNMQEDNMSNTVRVFLGTRLECAQCHDHPFDVWTQRDYFEMVAFTGGIQYRSNVDSEHADELMKLRRDNSLSRNEKSAIRKIIQPMTYGISGSGNGLARLPEDYEAGDGEPHEVVTGRTMFDRKPLVNAKVPSDKKPKRRRNQMKKFPQRIPNAPELESRKAYAEWLTDPESPRFATVIANRLWKQAMGLGLVEPVDTFSDETVASNEDLLDCLTEAMVELDFDMKQFLRAIYNSNAYQRTADSSSVPNPEEHVFNGPLVRRMQAEQIWDSLLTLAVSDTDVRAKQQDKRGLRYLPVKDMYAGYEQLRKLDVDQIKILAKASMERQNGNRKAMMNAMSEVFDKDQVAKPTANPYVKFRKQNEDINRRMAIAKKNKNRGLMRKLAAERQELATHNRNLRKSGDLRRASELPSPAKPGHFLREFGQSDREQIDNGNQESAVTQSLSMMNGFIESTVSRSRHSELMKNILSAGDAKAQINAAYMTMLSRKPKLRERELWLAAMERDQKVAVSDLIWTLANSVEFLFVK